MYFHSASIARQAAQKAKKRYKDPGTHDRDSDSDFDLDSESN